MYEKRTLDPANPHRPNEENALTDERKHLLFWQHCLSKLRSSDNLKKTKSSLTKKQSSPYFLLGVGI